MEQFRETLKIALKNCSNPQEIHNAIGNTIMSFISENWEKSKYSHYHSRRACYFSMEFLVGRAIFNNLLCLGLYEDTEAVLNEMGRSLSELEEIEDAALGNGGLGRLAACFLDSLATLGYSAYGCGIRYRYGMFKQEIRDGYQVEVPDAWLEEGYPFELRRPEYAKEVHFGGYVRVCLLYTSPSPRDA